MPITRKVGRPVAVFPVDAVQTRKMTCKRVQNVTFAGNTTVYNAQAGKKLKTHKAGNVNVIGNN